MSCSWEVLSEMPGKALHEEGEEEVPVEDDEALGSKGVIKSLPLYHEPPGQ